MRLRGLWIKCDVCGNREQVKSTNQLWPILKTRSAPCPICGAARLDKTDLAFVPVCIISEALVMLIPSIKTVRVGKVAGKYSVLDDRGGE